MTPTVATVTSSAGMRKRSRGARVRPRGGNIDALLPIGYGTTELTLDTAMWLAGRPGAPTLPHYPSPPHNQAHQEGVLARETTQVAQVGAPGPPANHGGDCEHALFDCASNHFGGRWQD